MKLNLPIIDQLTGAKNILIAGMGGGFDVFCGLPIFFELETLGFSVHLANLSFANISDLDDGETLTDTLVGVTGDIEGVFDYFPEYYLAQWLADERNDDITVWCFEKTGACPLIKNYQTLIKHLEIDTIILVDGGVDSLLWGDEPEPGTLFEDSLSLLAVNEIKNIRARFVAALGLGIETGIDYRYVFENIASLTKQQAFKGLCSLSGDMQSYRQFENAVMQVFDQQPEFVSVICSSVISAVQGEYGNYHLTKRTRGSNLRISPIMPIYWFFDLPALARNNLLLPSLRLTNTIDEAWKAMQIARKGFPHRPLPEQPLP